MNVIVHSISDVEGAFVSSARSGTKNLARYSQFRDIRLKF